MATNKACLIVFTPDVVQNVNGTILTVIYTFSSVFITIFNVALILGLMKTKKHLPNRKLSRSNYLFIFLSSCDILIGVIHMPFKIYLNQTSTTTTCAEAGVQVFWNVFLTTLAGMTICLIALERYLYITNKPFYSRYITSSFIKIWIMIEVLVALTWSLWYTFVSQTQSNKSHGSFMFCLAIFEGFILSSVIVINIKLVRYVKERAQITEEHFDAKNAIYQKKVSKTILIISIILMIYIMSGDGGDTSMMKYVIMWVIVPADLNSGINALVYILRNKDIVQFYKSLVKKRKEENTIEMNKIMIR